jgi:hypothetical protein
MAKRIPNAAEVAASLGQPPPRPAPPGRYSRLRPEERAEIVRSVRFTRAQIGWCLSQGGAARSCPLHPRPDRVPEPGGGRADPVDRAQHFDQRRTPPVD